jgi:hypothetical protein
MLGVGQRICHSGRNSLLLKISKYMKKPVIFMEFKEISLTLPAHDERANQNNVFDFVNCARVPSHRLFQLLQSHSHEKNNTNTKVATNMQDK